jgi:hypothetical protein
MSALAGDTPTFLFVLLFSALSAHAKFFSATSYKNLFDLKYFKFLA